MQQIVDFILELDRLKGVTRKTRPLGLDRYENSAEHSWQIALLAASLAHHAQEAVDVDRVIAMLLVHDIGEIETGDTIVYAEHGWEERKQAEYAAVTRIFGLLPAPQADRFMALWQEFESGETAEARHESHDGARLPAVDDGVAAQGPDRRDDDVVAEAAGARLEGDADSESLQRFDHARRVVGVQRRDEAARTVGQCGEDELAVREGFRPRDRHCGVQRTRRHRRAPGAAPTGRGGRGIAAACHRVLPY